LEDARDALLIGMADPTDIFAYDELTRVLRRPLKLAVVREADLLKTIDIMYRRTAEISGLAQELEQEMSENDVDLGALASAEGLTDAPVVKLLQTLFEDAIQVNASDIHIEPDEKELRIRFRLDGVLRVQTTADRRITTALLSRLNLMAGLDISEKRLPQDGTFMVKLEDRTIDLRISIIPTIYGEKVVMRILDRTGVILELDQMGFEEDDLVRLRRAIFSPYGLVFLTGPTGSGKSTTLYAILQEIKSTEKNIVTVEDPVEYRLTGINQVQVKPEIGLTFASALRSFLRQDPDIMLVGEVRDLETAEICVRSALTGHLVLSTLHTNDAPSAVTRLIDIGVEPFLLAPTILVVVGQRLVRKLCPECKEAYKPTAKELGSVKLGAETIYRAKGCPACNNTGYRGRTLVAEIMSTSEDIKSLITQNVSYQKMRDLARKLGMTTLYESGLKKVEKGVTSLEEVMTVTFGI